MHSTTQLPRRLEFIYFADSIEDLRSGDLRKVPIEEAEALIAKHRNIEKFEWMENLPEEFAGSDYAERIIDPEKIALCYFGEDVGYAPVAIQTIYKGEILIFSGEIRKTQEDVDISSNPYLISYMFQPKNDDQDISIQLMDAKRKGGFASMLMDAPEENVINYLVKKENLQSPIASRNFQSMFLKAPNGALVLLNEAAHDILPGELLCLNYAKTFRLGYPAFVGFFKDGSRLQGEAARKLNRAIDKVILYNDLTLRQAHLYKTINKIAKENFSAAIKHLLKENKNMEELKTKELLSLLSFLASETIEYYINAKDRLVAFTLINYELRMRETNGERKFINRKLTKSIVQTNKRQLEHKGKAPLFSSNACNYFIIYPGIEIDFLKVSVRYKRKGNSEKSSFYMKQAIFFCKQNGTDKQILEFYPKEGQNNTRCKIS